MEQLLTMQREKLYSNQGEFEEGMIAVYKEQARIDWNSFENKLEDDDSDTVFSLRFRLTGMDGQKFKDMTNLQAREAAMFEACHRFNCFAAHYGLSESDNEVYETKIDSYRDFSGLVSLKGFTEKQRKKICKNIKKRLLEEMKISSRVSDFFTLCDAGVLDPDMLELKYRYNQMLGLFGLEEHVKYTLKKDTTVQAEPQAQ
ncbi:hypothetical protein [Saccharibacillus kuerlensis]|uniref:Uncharacterized protein n=1 Tax=Saccharibacillus kuerlensis TaxID=459527 RepID=A0ABQ2KWI0_9BACL|nr:hypothetical protein [Saccharibacillus kuerlensis]GGN95002.1 hypothetical protein GCM10010969_10280 [Saccharibacillus kuerlensis]